MSKHQDTHVKTFCSLMNYLEIHDKDLFKLFKELCIAHILKPHKDSGITLLRPTGKLLIEIEELACGDKDGKVDEEKAESILRSCVIYDYIDNPDNVATSNAPTANNNRRVTIEGKVERDTKFSPREYRSNMAVYILKDALPKLTDEVVEPISKKKKDAKGGLDISSNRAQLAMDLCQQYSIAAGKRDPYLELMCSLLHWSEKKAAQLHNDICNELSWSPLVSFYVIIKPFYEGNEHIVNNESFQNFAKEMSISDAAYYKCGKDPFSYYKQCLVKGANNRSGKRISVAELQKKNINSLSRAKVVNIIDEIIKQSGGNTRSLDMLKAEAEVRLIGHLLYDSCIGSIDPDLIILNFHINFTMHKPVMLYNKELVKSADIAHYYSGVFLLAHSDLLVYTPCENPKQCSLYKSNDVTDDSALISTQCDEYEHFDNCRKTCNYANAPALE